LAGAPSVPLFDLALDDADVAAGLIRLAPPRRPTVWTLLDLENKDHELQVVSDNAETANLFVRRRLFERVGLFADDEPAHGDFDFVERCATAGARVVFAPAAVVSHPTRDGGASFLRNTWEMHRSYAARQARNGARPDRLRLRTWIPILPVLRARRRWGRSLGLDRRRLAQSGVRPRLRDDLRALPFIYLVLPALVGAAQLRGWLDGRRARHARAVGATETSPA
jgi:GT2 family glycosyltransferase